MIHKIAYYPIIIKESYLDTFSHMNNATYFTLFEEARWELITKNGYGLQKVVDTGLGPTILEMNIRYMKELTLRDEVIIETQLLSYKSKIGKLRQQMVRAGEVCCVVEITIALFDLAKRKLVLPTEEWLRALRG